MRDGITDPKELYEHGLAAAQREDESGYPEAHSLFAQAFALVPREIHNLGVTALRADILRADAFIYTREATLEPNPVSALNRITLAQIGLDKAQVDVARFLSYEARQLHPEDRASLHANLGATFSLLGRTAVVAKEISLRADLPQDRRVNHQIREAFSEAHNYLKHGDDGYLLTSNALAAARFEMAFGALARAGQWLGRSILALYWTRAHDPHNYERAAEMFRAHKGNLLTPDAAEQSIFTKP